MNHNRLPSNAAIPTLNYAISLLILHLYVLLNYINTNVVTKIKGVVFFYCTSGTTLTRISLTTGIGRALNYNKQAINKEKPYLQSFSSYCMLVSFGLLGFATELKYRRPFLLLGHFVLGT